MDTYSTLKGNRGEPALITGKPLPIGGSLGRTEADWKRTLFYGKRGRQETKYQYERGNSSRSRIW